MKDFEQGPCMIRLAFNMVTLGETRGTETRQEMRVRCTRQ